MKDLTRRPIRWGIIGLGNIAGKFATDLVTVPGAQLYAVASRHQYKANSFAKQFNAEKAYGTYEALAADPLIDAVYIATPHSFHKANTILCLNSDKAVLCEKPFAMHQGEVEEMLAVAKANKVLLMEALWTYFLPHYQFALKLLATKQYGKILKLEADFGFRPELDFSSRVFKKSLGGGSLLDVGIYPIFVALTTLGKPSDIDAKASFFENGVDAVCEMIFNYPDGVKAFLKSSLLENTPTEAVFYCEKATIKINSRFHEPSTVSILKNGKEEVKTFGYNTIGYSYEIAHFNELLRKGHKESPLMSHEMSKLIIKTLDHVRQLIDLEYEK